LNLSVEKSGKKIMSETVSAATKTNRLKFFIGGGLLLIAVVFMVISATKATAEFFMTVRELQDSQSDLSGQNLRVSGAVLGDSIIYDTATGELRFLIAHIPGDDAQIRAAGGLSAVLHRAVTDPDNPRLTVSYQGPPPDMLRDEAQAILTGKLDADGIFVAEELLLKCPSKYEEALPGQVEQ
jgi:cytochrome c-type biogenesis protein CcmE